MRKLSPSPTHHQQAIVEAQQKLVAVTRELIIQTTLARIWGEEKSIPETPPPVPEQPARELAPA